MGVDGVESGGRKKKAPIRTSFRSWQFLGYGSLLHDPLVLSIIALYFSNLLLFSCVHVANLAEWCYLGHIPIAQF